MADGRDHCQLGVGDEINGRNCVLEANKIVISEVVNGAAQAHYNHRITG